MYKYLLRKRMKKGFTIVELVIVIAVIAILSAVLIPTFVNVTRTAKIAADTALVKNLNTVLAMDSAVNGKHTTMHDTMQVILANGYSVELITPTSEGYNYAWDQESDKMVLLDKEYKLFSDGTIPTAKYKLWLIADSQADIDTYKTEGFSAYLSEAYSGAVTTSKGIDVGNNTDITSIEYTNNGDEQDVIIRTNGGTLTVNAPNDTISHYNTVDSVNIVQCADHSYNEMGKAKIIEALQGNIVIDESAEVGTFVIPATQTGMVSLDNRGAINLLKTKTASKTISISNNGSVDVAVVDNSQASSITGAKPQTSYDKTEKLTNNTHVI